ncbi:hypothetical protein LCGC14_2628080 [marine sediment metagenome]|uniref:Antitoxin n=1 Tax=marine sediment metagenome TaxID=412755 RepID=A0A0F9A189_9ZZZZ
MKTATIRQVQHNLAEILRQVEAGEEFKIVRRNHPVARLIPIKDVFLEDAADWSEHTFELNAIFKGKTVTGKPMQEIVSEGRGDY